MCVSRCWKFQLVEELGGILNGHFKDVRYGGIAYRHGFHPRVKSGSLTGPAGHFDKIVREGLLIGFIVFFKAILLFFSWNDSVETGAIVSPSLWLSLPLSIFAASLSPCISGVPRCSNRKDIVSGAVERWHVAVPV